MSRETRVRKDCLVAIDYTIRNARGEVIDTTDGRKPFVYVHGRDEIVPGIEEALTGAGEGSSMEFSIAPREAYGERDPEALRVVPRHAFPSDHPPEKGCLYRAVEADGAACIFTVVETTASSVLVDMNHPLAGQRLDVHVHVLSVMGAPREASPS